MDIFSQKSTGDLNYEDPAIKLLSPFVGQDTTSSATSGAVTGGITGGYTGASTPSYSQQDMDYLNNQESLYNRLLQSVGSTLESGLNRLNTSEQDARSGATLQNDRAMRDYGIQRETSSTEKEKALGRVGTNARTLSDSVRRMLGLASGANSSAFKFAAPNAIARDASGKRGDVMYNYGKNDRNINLAMDDTKVDFDRILSDIAKKRQSEEESLRAGVLGQEQGIQQSLAEIAAERARLQNGNTLAAMRPYQDRYLGIQNELDALPSRFAVGAQPAVKVTTPQLSDYLVDKTAINASKQSGQTQYSPYSAFLTRQKEEDERMM